jgi:Cu+-exporting ATPase
MASTSEVVRLPVAGMTCDHCVGTVRRALEAVPGVQSAAVDLKQGRAEVTLDPAQADRDRLKGAIEAAGYSVPENEPAGPEPELVPLSPVLVPAPKAPPAEEEWNLAIGGMHCASCVARVEGALTSVPGVREARANLATERASVVVDPGRVDEAALAEAVARAGYSARRAELDLAAGAEALRRERDEQIAYWRTRLMVGLALAIPLVILGYGPMLAPSLLAHAAWVPWVMFALATVLQVYLGGPYLKGAWERLKQGSSNMDTLIALGTMTAYGYSVAQLLLGHSHRAQDFMNVVSVPVFLSLTYSAAVIYIARRFESTHPSMRK